MTFATAGAGELTASSVTLAVATTIATSLARGGAIAPPLALLPGRRKKDTNPQNNSHNNKLDVYLKRLNQIWFEIPELFRFFVSGNLGNMCFFAIERTVHHYLCQIEAPTPLVDEHKDSISFFLGYILQMGSQHLLHAWLVYGLHTINTREKYLTTLFGQCSAYFTAMIGSTILNNVLRRQGVSKNVAFFITLYLFACINYFVIGWVVRRAVVNAEAHQLELSSKGKKRSPLRMRGGTAWADMLDTKVNEGGVRSCEQLPFGARSVRSLILSIPEHTTNSLEINRLSTLNLKQR